MRKRIAITGATSFVGRALVQTLLDRGCECCAIVRPESPHAQLLPQHPRLRVLLRDMTQTALWAKDVGSLDAMYHLGWDGSGMQGRADGPRQERNVRHALQCLETAAALGAKRFLFAGSQAEYGPQHAPTDEQAPCAPVTPYGQCKLETLNRASALAKELGVEYVHMRIFSVYGPGDHPWTLASSCVKGFCAGEEVALSACTQRWNFLHVRDAAAALSDLLDAPVSADAPVFNIASEDTRPLRDFVEEIHRLAGGRGTPLFGARAQGIEKPFGIDPVIDKLIAATGWTQKVAFEEGIREWMALKRAR